MNRLAYVILSALLVGGTACPRSVPPAPPVAPPPQTPARIVRLGDVGDIALLQLHLDGWDALTPQQRVLAYHLSLAAIAGDPITYDQRYARNLEIKILLEGILAHAGGLDPAVRDRVLSFLERFWIHHGVHDATTLEHFVPDFTYDELLMAALDAFNSGERFGYLDEDDLRHALEDLAPALFDARRDRWLMPPHGASGEDVLRDSASNEYAADLTIGDLDGFRERHPLNSTIERDADGHPFEHVWRAGRDEVPPGLYAPQLRRVVGHLRDALPLADEAQQTALGALIDTFETGAPASWTAWETAWTTDDPAVDAVLGFVEPDADPRGRKGTWEGLVLVRDEARTARLRALAAAARALLDGAPWPADVPRPAPPEAQAADAAPPEVPVAADVLTATGDAALLTPTALRLPNDPDVRRTAGSKDLELANVDDALRAVFLEPAIREFAFDDAEAAEARRCGDAAWQALTAVHDVLGGTVVPAAPDASSTVTLAEYAGTIAAARADLLALYFAEDPRLVALGLLPDRACGEAALRDYVRGALLLLRALPDDAVAGDGPRAHLLVVRYAVERGAVTVERRGGKTYLRIPDVPAWHDVIDELLATVERIRVRGDYDAARALVETYGARAPDGWREEAARRAELAGLPARFAFVPPSLEPVRDASGAIVDVRLVDPVDFPTLMMSWKAVAEAPLPPAPPPAPAAEPEPPPAPDEDGEPGIEP